MEEWKKLTLQEALGGNEYPGRGILIGNALGKAVTAYFIMGRSENSRNRVFCIQDGILKTVPFDETKVQDPSLIIYNAVRTFENRLIVTNGDQTDTVYEAFRAGKSFEEALDTRTFEPDAPNFTPRISGALTIENGTFSYKLGIVKCGDGEGKTTGREYYDFAPEEGIGHLLHTYDGNGHPLPSFSGAPKAVRIPGEIGEFTEELWNVLDPDNRISLYVRFTDPSTGAMEERIRNKNQKCGGEA